MTDVIEFAAAFVFAIVAGNYNTAHQMLTSELGVELDPTAISAQFEALADDMGGVTGIGEPMLLLEEWPDMLADDLALVYVPLEGDVYSEAIQVSVAKVGNTLRISSIEWGRP